MALDTNTDVEQLKRVDDADGDPHPPANASEQQATNERLGNFASGVDDEAFDDTTGTTLPSHDVPEGVEVVVQAKHENTERVRVGLSDTPTVSLPQGSSINYRVRDTSQIWLVSNSDGDGVNITVEQN